LRHRIMLVFQIGRVRRYIAEKI